MFRTLWEPIRGRAKLGILSWLAAFAGTLILLAFIGWMMQHLLGFSIVSRSIWVVGGIMSLLIGGCSYLEHYFGHDFAFRILANFRNRVFGKVRRLGINAIQHQEASDLVTMVSSDVDAMEVFYAHTLVPIAKGVAYTIVVTFIYGRVNLLWGLIVAGTCLLLGVVLPFVYHYQLQRLNPRLNQQRLHWQRYLYESLAGRQAIHQLGIKDNRLDTLFEYSTSYTQTQIEVQSISHYQAVCRDVLLWMGWFALAMVTQYQSIQDYRWALVFAYPFIFDPLLSLSFLPGSLEKGLQATRRVMALLDQSTPISGTAELSGINQVMIESGEFTYPKQESPILKDIYMEVYQGDMIGLIGPNGSGKSTIARILMGWYELNQGRVLWNDQPREFYSEDAMNEVVTYLNQTPDFFTMSLRENLTLHRQYIDEALWDVLDQVNLKERVQGLSQGLDTPLLPERPIFSSGEQQRLDLARALLHPSSVLILDEPTSHLDPDQERQMIELVRSTYSGIVILITHHASSLTYCDRVYQIQDGQLKPRLHQEDSKTSSSIQNEAKS